MSNNTIRAALVRAPLSLLAFAAVSAAPSGALAQQAPDTERHSPSGFPQDESDLRADSRVTYGQLENGLRYAVMHNETPSGVAAIRMRINTGSWNETDAQQGIAHFLEHMAFNGSANVPEGEMVKRLERHGLAFGADTNASTGFAQTVYKLNLPTVDDEVVDEALFLMRETADNLLLDEGAIDRERGVIAAEKTARDSVSFRSYVDSMRFYTEGSGRTDRLPIGLDETIATMPREEFVRFYNAYYRPENAFLVFVGDIDPERAVEKIRAHFADWKPEGQAGAERALVAASNAPDRVGYYHDPEVLTYVTLGTLYESRDPADSFATRKANFLRNVGNTILNRRLSRMVDEGKAPFLAASSGRYHEREVVDGNMIRLRSDPNKWQESLAAGDLETRRALKYGFTQAELDEQLASVRRRLEVAVDRANTRKTYASREYNYADALVDAFDSERVFTSPQTNLESFDKYVDGLTVEDVNQAFREGWRGYDHPAVYLSTALDIEDPHGKVEEALAHARTLSVDPPEAREIPAFAFTDFGTPGKVISQEHLEDVDAWLVRFDNNVLLNLKQTDFDDDTIYLMASAGDGFFSMPAGSDEGLRRLALNLLSRSGVGEHTSDDLRTIFAGKRVAATPRLKIDNDAIDIIGATNGKDLPDELNLMAAYAVAPSYRETIASQYKDQMRAWYPTHDADPQSVAQKELPRLLRSGDERYGYGDLDSFLAPTTSDVQQWLDPELKQGLIQITVVGDFNRQEVIDQVARTFGALPDRAASKGAYPEAHHVTFPARPESPVTLFHHGVDNQALVRVYWPAPDGTDPVQTYRAIALRSILRNRLTDKLREELGTTYSPGVGIESDEAFPDFGYMFASVTVAPENAEMVVREIENVADELAESGVESDEFKRAIQPLLDDLPQSEQNNAYWIDVLRDAQTGGFGIEKYRLREPAYHEMKESDLDTLARSIFNTDRAYPVMILPASE